MSNQGTKENSEQAEHSEQQDAHSEQQSAHSDSADSDAGVTFTPIFETGEAELSGDFRQELTKSTYSNGVRWAIANNPSRPLEGNPTPFYRDTVEQVYDYWKAEFIEESNYKDTEGKKTEYTKFTFIVVDEQCLQSDPWEIIIACDAPDYGEAEDEVKLKYFRMPFEDGASCLDALEYLSMTPSEAQNHSNDVLSGFPPASMMPVREESGEWYGAMRPATREEGRRNKRRMLMENS